MSQHRPAGRSRQGSPTRVALGDARSRRDRITESALLLILGGVALGRGRPDVEIDGLLVLAAVLEADGDGRAAGVPRKWASASAAQSRADRATSISPGS